MYNPKRKKIRLSPLDWYKLFSSFLFLALGGFLFFRFFFATQKRFWTQLILGGLILGYGIYRLIAAYRNLRRVLSDQNEWMRK
jgi:uncharacterized membrane protein HdeD (DUF308 family)